MAGPSPYTIEQGTIVEIIIEGLLFDQTTLSVFHYKYDGDSTYSNGPRAVDDLLDFFFGADQTGAVYTNSVSSDLDLVRATGQVIYPVRRAKRSHDLNIPGQVGGDSLPSNECAVITRRSDNATDRSHETHKGQVSNLHLPGLVRSAVTGDLINDTYLASTLNPLAATLPNAITTSGESRDWYPVIVHRGTTPLSSDYVTEATAQKDARVMRRRTFRVGV